MNNVSFSFPFASEVADECELTEKPKQKKKNCQNLAEFKVLYPGGSK